jgi:hypothetical protein
MGGSDDKTLKHNFTLKKCLAFKNKAKGFDQNNNKGTMILYNCTGHNNLVVDYMHLAPGSDLIDAGVDVGLPYEGVLPDLGCFETLSTGVQDISFSPKILCYPNPVIEKGILQFSLKSSGRCEIRLLDISGR